MESGVEGRIEARSPAGLVALQRAGFGSVRLAEVFRSLQLQKAGAEERHHCHGNDVRGEKRNHDGQGHRGKKKLAHPC